jgi:broad specificity phosphatase PhoE
MGYIKIFLLRHAHVDYDSHHGPDSDAPLSPKGEAQIEWLCRYFDVLPLDHIISSPYKRTIQTITPLAQSKGLSIDIEAWLRECDDTMFEYTEKELNMYWAEHTITNWQHFASTDVLELRQQEIHEGLAQLLGKYGLVKRGFLYDGVLERDWSILLCGHVGSLETVAAYFLNLHPIHCLFTMHVENASVSLFEISRDERLSSEPYRCWLRFWNQSPIVCL